MAKSRTSKVAFFRLIQQATLPVYVVGDNLRLVFCNEATCQWTGQDAEFLTGLTCIYHSGVDLAPSQQVAAGLCPPATSFQGQTEDAFVFAHRDGALEFRAATFYPLQLAEGSACGVLAIVHGQVQASPETDSDSSQRRSRDLHASVAHMQYEATTGINLDLIVGSSSRSKQIRRQIQVASQTGSNLLIAGRSGSGRRQIAELVHFAHGPHQAGPLIPIDGALSDAETVQRTIKDLYRNFRQNPDEPFGRLLLLDIDRMSQAAQTEIEGFLGLPDFRLPMMGTCVDPACESIRGNLLNELATITIELPPLSQRREDIPFLAQALLEEHNLKKKSTPTLAGLDREVIDMLIEYPWHGEFSELRETVESACHNASGPTVVTDDLPRHFRMAVRSLGEGSAIELTINLDQFLSDIELELVERALDQAGNNKSRAATLLGISRARLIRRMSQIGLETDSANEFDSKDRPPNE